ncbi:MAG TPA: hypothetical protein DIS87_09945 [Armatimonadetes bacterium]|nr:hypothetical protein [Armatimonadota bacterium]
MRSQAKPRNSGHTLIEIMIASFLVLSCALIFAATMPTANTSRAKANFNNQATALAQKQMESLKSRGFANLTGAQMIANGLIDNAAPVSADTWEWTDVDNGENDSPADVLPDGEGTVTVQQVRFDLRRVTIRVTWRERDTDREVVVASLVGNL